MQTCIVTIWGHGALLRLAAALFLWVCRGWGIVLVVCPPMLFVWSSEHGWKCWKLHAGGNDTSCQS